MHCRKKDYWEKTKNIDNEFVWFYVRWDGREPIVY